MIAVLATSSGAVEGDVPGESKKPKHPNMQLILDDGETDGRMRIYSKWITKQMFYCMR